MMNKSVDCRGLEKKTEDCKVTAEIQHRRARCRDYYARNKDVILAKNKEYYHQNRAEVLAYMKKYWRDHKKQKSQYARVYRQEHAEEIRQQERKKRYGLSNKEYEALSVKQRGCCAICKTSFLILTRRTIVIDHDHNTGAVRGILCTNCNLGVGNFKDNPEILKSALIYLNNASTIHTTMVKK